MRVTKDLHALARGQEASEGSILAESIGALRFLEQEHPQFLPWQLEKRSPLGPDARIGDPLDRRRDGIVEAAGIGADFLNAATHKARDPAVDIDVCHLLPAISIGEGGVDGGAGRSAASVVPSARRAIPGSTGGMPGQGSLTTGVNPTGTEIVVPNVFRSEPRTRPARIVIYVADKTLELFDANSRLLAHFPCSIARRVEKRPTGGLEVVVTAPDPNYTIDPQTFPDSPEAQSIGRKLILKPGPNNPVGVAWISLSLPGYGIHGSPEPEQIGRTKSSGCFRLANWNASFLLPLVYPGMPVQVEP
ncbi:MAG TPA: L,D-transpeptidase [Opitutaceae bacterium]